MFKLFLLFDAFVVFLCVGLYYSELLDVKYMYEELNCDTVIIQSLYSIINRWFWLVIGILLTKNVLHFILLKKTKKSDLEVLDD